MINLKDDVIEELCEKEKAREKLPVFYGSYDNYYHGFREVLNNAVDELLNNFGYGDIIIKLEDDCRTISVKDTGRGIPINSKENVKKLLETLFASGKYEANSKTNSGVNGVGNTILMYTSEYFECTSKMITEKKIYNIAYQNSGEILKELACLGNTEEHGTEIKFRLDPSIYTETIFSSDVMEDIINKISLVSEDIKFTYIHNGEEKIYQNNMYEFFERNSKDTIGENEQLKTGNFERQVEVERKGKKEIVDELLTIDLIFAPCTSEGPFKMNMLNGNNLIEYGTIHDGVLEGFKQYINNYCKKEKLYKKNEKPISNVDVENAITYACRIFNNLVEFESQVKFSTKKDYYKQCAKEYIVENLEIYKLEKEKQFKRLVDQILICKRANDINLKARQSLKKKLTEKVDGINVDIDGFVDCELEKGGELFLVEGKSANGSVVLSRDSHFQASYPLRGKLLNLLKAKWNDILNNKEIMDIIQLLGCGIEVRNKFTKDLPKFDINKLRFNKIILTADADSDGRQINTLILTAIYVLCPTLITEGYVYIAQPPIFQIDSGKIRKYAMSVKEKDNIVKELNNVEVHRLKGLGEMSAEVMHETVCNPKTRVLQQVIIKDEEKMREKFKIWMDTDVEDRKNIITNNLNKYLVDAPIPDITNEKNITDIIEDNMMEYSADVIFDRALVSIESGLKPSQVRSLYAMYKNNVTKLTKSMNVTGYITQYHPHGSAYGTLVNMCQEDRHLNTLIDYEGNLGQHTSRDLMEASERYTNIKLSKLALDGLKEIDDHFVEMIDTYDNKRKMPLYIPNKYPLALTQSTQGMAVGMASKTVSFNLDEVNNSIIKYIQTKEKTLLVPDFATGGEILYNQTQLEKINNEGKGTVRLRGKYKIEDDSVIFYEIPYGIKREAIKEKVVQLIKSGSLKECILVKDLTDIKGMKIKLKCKKNTDLNSFVSKLFKLTQLESSFDCNMNMLYKGMPSVYGVWSVVDKWIEFRKECLINGINYQIDNKNKELHKLEGFEKIVKDLDKVIEIIRYSKNIREDLKKQFNIDDVQCDYIENMQFININEIYINKQIKDINELRNTIITLNHNKSNNEYLENLIVEGLQSILKKYPTSRRTKIVESFDEIKKEELQEDYKCRIQITKEGYFKKTKLTGLNTNNKLKDGDSIHTMLECNNKDEVLLFAQDLNCYKYKLYELSETKLSNIGQYLKNDIKQNILGMSVVSDKYKYVLITYNDGNIAKISLDSYKTKQNRQCLNKSLNNKEVLFIHTLEDDCDIEIKVSDGRIKTINTNELTLNKSRSSSGKKIVTWKNVSIDSVNIINKSVDNKLI